MAEQKPLVLDDGVPTQLASSDTLEKHVSVSSETTTTGAVKVAVVTALPETPDANTLYFVTAVS